MKATKHAHGHRDRRADYVRQRYHFAVLEDTVDLGDLSSDVR